STYNVCEKLALREVSALAYPPQTNGLVKKDLDNWWEQPNTWRPPPATLFCFKDEEAITTRILPFLMVLDVRPGTYGVPEEYLVTNVWVGGSMCSETSTCLDEELPCPLQKGSSPTWGNRLTSALSTPQLPVLSPSSQVASTSAHTLSSSPVPLISSGLTLILHPIIFQPCHLISEAASTALPICKQ
ncbi:unnamed protein product, partial [Pleuronectes platessa]